MAKTPMKRPAAFQHDRTVGEETWLTPRSLVEALDLPTLADVDPCSPPVRPWPTARQHFTRNDDGFNRAWDPKKFYFVNPPYGRECAGWMAKAAEHGNGLLLVFARTDTRQFHESVWRHEHTSAVLFFEGRLRFATIDGVEIGSAGAPSALVAYGTKAKRALIQAVSKGRIRGRIVLLDDAQRDVFRLGVESGRASKKERPSAD
ncbi:MAG: adenine methyltransferase [Luteibacter sp.]|uniref:adenine methyltransferase n=1 Tax=Luteibacter sp. TaxID=1886636 RepID=UPI0028076474|nr:adenine methyltransferase [Luteibacter sp.]MDQ7995198.1 adenine methyltransferase [Luteibacter sp.]